MKENFIEMIACPHCKGSLKLASDFRKAGTEIESGRLECGCGKTYPVVNSIPRFTESDEYVKNFSFEWNRFSKTQLDSANNTRISEERFKEITGLYPRDLEGKRVLEIGCGMGRFLEIAARHAKEAVGLDLSYSVDSARENLRGFKNLHLVQASIFYPPFKNYGFDVVYSIGVLHHTPYPKEAFLKLSGLVSKNGIAAIWYSPRQKLSLLPRATNLARFFTTRIKSGALFKIIKTLVPAALPLVRMPFIGRFLKGWFIPVCDYKGELPLTKKQLLEWSILDTFDLLSPRYLYPATGHEIRKWFLEAGLRDIIITQPLVTARGIKNGR